ncbi:KEOPS complex subunit Cgi121 [Methanobacterium sp. SMA-27]|uniref:KEOPS complex subunit Cgi121 n=1 Tax=Methanobacterium sp. SMA-27 TaxID=1495336 RepID=UPI00064F1E76|nr:KEOPS complex subunit Cgi121 [Methanobacterium sp. SMA-27]
MFENSGELGCNIQVAGFKSHITNIGQVMADLKQFDNCMIQLMDAEGIAGREHAIHATIHAINTFSRKENIANDLGIEICVRMSGQRQISQALKTLGIKNGDVTVCVIAVDCKADVMDKLTDILDERDDKVLEPDEDKLKNMYHISDIEAETAGSITKLLMEKTALLILET